MKLIVGLGNIGEKHQKNRHNLGFMVVDQFFRNFEPVEKTNWDGGEKFKSTIARIEWNRHSSSPRKTSGQAGQAQEIIEKIILCRPKTFMNNSGLAVSLLTTYYKLQPDDIWVVHDDIDLPLGSVRIRFGGSAAGHRGIESIIKELETEKFWRFRLGISHPGRSSKFKVQSSKLLFRDVDEFVLGDFTGSEKGKVKDLIKHAAKAIAHALEHDLQSAMNRFNTK